MNIIQKFRVSFYGFILGLFKNSFLKIKPSFSKSDIGKEGINKTIVIFYNLSSIDSVISSAVLYWKMINKYGGERSNVIAVAASNRMPVIFEKNFANYFWVGVIPSNDLLRYLKSQTKDVSHYIYNVDKEKSKYPYINHNNVVWVDQSTSLESLFKEFEEHSTDLCFYKDVHESQYFKTLLMQVSANNVNFHLSKLISDFTNNATQSLSEQVTVFKLYNMALETLTRRANFNADDVEITEVDFEKLKAASLLAKDSLTRLFEYTSFKLNGEYQRLPLINIGQLHQPMAARILMQSYDFFVFYEQQGMQSVYTPYSRIAGFDKYVMNNISGGKNGRLSSEM